MLDLEEFVNIGYIRKGHGYKGHARLMILDNCEEDLLEQQFLFLEIDGYKVPYFIEEIQNHKELIVKLEHINSVETLKKLHKKSIFLLKKEMRNAPDFLEENDSASSIVGFTIYDQTKGNLGPIIRIDQYPQQEMAVIHGDDGKEVLIPLHPSLIDETNTESKIIKMDLPEGLV